MNDTNRKAVKIMDFESPDVEKDFPGLFASESIKKGNESDFSDENHDKSYKKDLITGKKKEKRDSKKDRGYAALEGESSADENTDSKSPSKSKKSKSFKFPSKKSEKREKSREKDAKDKDPEKEKKKEKDKKEKDKVKQKDKKKSRHGEDASESNGDYPVFGVDLAASVERSGCLDGISIPLIVRNCIDCIHYSGLSCEGLYKTLGVKSKVLALKRAYDLREPVSLKDHDVYVSTCLLKMFLRELPEPLLTRELSTRFEEAGAIMEVDAREIELQNLVKQLPYHNRILLSWLIVHFDTVTLHEKQNKLNAQSIAMTFSPVLQMSHRLLTALLCHCKTLFPDTVIEKYVPPLCAGSSFPESSEEIANELKKQESLLNQIHTEMSQGFVSKKREEQLWEVQRIVTQLKRTLRSLQRSQETSMSHRSLDEDQSACEDAAYSEDSKRTAEKEDARKAAEEAAKDERPPEAKGKAAGEPEKGSSNESNETEDASAATSETDGVGQDGKRAKIPQSQLSPRMSANAVPPSGERPKSDRNLENLRLQLEREHLSKLQAALEERLEHERQLVERLQSEIRNLRLEKDAAFESRAEPSNSPYVASESDDKMMARLAEENNALMKKKEELVRRIFDERLACLHLKVNINLILDANDARAQSQLTAV